MKNVNLMRGRRILLLCIGGILLCLISLGLVQSSAVEKAVRYATANTLLKGSLIEQDPVKLSRGNTLSGMFSRLKEVSDKLKQLKKDPQSLPLFFDRRLLSQPATSSPAPLKDRAKARDVKNPFISAMAKQRESSAKPSSKPDEVLVKFKPFTSRAASQSILSNMGMQAVKHFKQVDVHLVKTAPGMKVKDALEKLRKNPSVIYAEPNYQRRAFATLPNDPDFSLQWGLNNTGQTGGAEDADIDAPEAWDVRTDASDTVIAVIDTGVDYNHVDLAGSIWTNAGEIAGDSIDNDGNGYVDDMHGINAINGSGDPMDDMYEVYHGTHCAGIIAAAGNNGTGISGVCWSAQIMALKFLDEGGGGWDDDAIECIEYMVNMKNAYGVNVKVSSNSWGGGGYSYALEDAINLAGDSDILFIAAAGNDYGNDNDINPVYPASYDCFNIISVAASDADDGLAYFSNYGYNSVDVAAPGVDIWSAKRGNDYQYLSGTSMATPHVAGLAGLIASYYPGSSYLDIQERIFRTVDEKSGLVDKIASGGRINASSALTMDIQGPFIYSISLPVATHGDEVIIQGAQFGDTQGSGYVTFYENVTAPVSSWSDNQIVTTVPDGCQSGPVTVTTDEGTSNGKLFALAGVITGRVTDENSAGMENMPVIVSPYNYYYFSWVGGDLTDANGDYRIVVPAGEYAVVVWSANPCYFVEGYDNIHNPGRPEDCTAVTVLEGQETTGINVQLDLGGSVSGNITDQTGNLLEGIKVDVYNSDGYNVTYSWSASGGHYTACGLTSEDYYVATWGGPAYGTTAPVYFGEWYNDTGPCDGDPPVGVIAPEETSGIDFELAFAWEDSFESDNTCNQAKPIATDGTPQEHTLYPLQDQDWMQFDVAEQTAVIIETFNLSPECDTYLLLYDSDCKWLSYDDNGGCGYASRITYTIQSPGTYFVQVLPYDWVAGTGTYNVKITLIPLGTISGRVFKDDAPNQGIADVRVIAQDYQNDGSGEVQTDSSGYYTVGLLPGKYLVAIENDADLDYPYLEIYDGAYSPTSDKVKLVEVVSETNTGNIDFGMPPAQSISGRVIGIDREEEVCIEIMDSNPLYGFWYDRTCNQGPGDYIVSGLHPDGGYLVGTLGSLGYLFYDNAMSLMSAEPVTPPRNDIDFDLNLSGCLIGQITDAATSDPIPNAYVNLFSAETGQIEGITWADSSGRYTLDHLPLKTYQVKVSPDVWDFPSDAYCSQVKEATVSSSGCVAVDFQLSECTIPCMNLGAGEGSGRIGDTVTIPISVENFQDQFYGMEVGLFFDNAMLELTGISSGEIDAALFYPPVWMSNLDGGVYMMAFFDVSAQGSGSLVKLDFTILSGTPGEEILLPLYAWPVCQASYGKIIVEPPCNADDECDDGSYCNGSETCVAGTCQQGTARCADDGLFCNGSESCNEDNDSCSHSGNPCSSNQVCNEVNDICQPGPTTTTSQQSSTTTTAQQSTTTTTSQQSSTTTTIVNSIEASTNAFGSSFFFLSGFVTIQGKGTDFTLFGSVIKYDPPAVLKGPKVVNQLTQTITQFIIVLPSWLQKVPDYPATVTVTVDGLSADMEIKAFPF